ncbi:hypothetical protein PMKS-001471 [Pichia membranifaciens]|uniref:Pop1 N-terminal domain-containing protein n=1 Tax=Pichia membranifaciens TaxID=4926 RepID=A0A1Q2YF30_9ASCO|nr:hypothetical protein PMKS-001471 [Pichia membranifaciens]
MQSLPNKPSTAAGRKKNTNTSTASNNNPTCKRTKLYNSRQIRTQIQDESFTNPPKGANTAQQVRKMLSNGSMIPNKLNIPDYLSAREFEIRALDSAIIKSKNSGASRVFQALPRTLRRRTASHNVRRIPKRMRRKALREMGLQLKAGSTTTALGTKGVTVTGKPIKPKIGRGKTRWSLIRKMKLLKYAAKWKIKGILPNSQWISISQINLRKKLKLLKKDLKVLDKQSPSQEDDNSNLKEWVKSDVIKIKKLASNIHNQLGSYDNTSVNKLSKIGKVTSVQYATRQKNFKWLPTHIWHAKRAKMMKRWEWTIPLEPTQRCYRSTSRASRLKGAVASDTSYFGSLVINAYSKESMKKVLSYILVITKNKVNYKSCLSKGIAWDGYVYDINDSSDPIGRMTLAFIENTLQNTCRVMARLHPSIFSTVYSQLVGNFESVEGVTIHDCKYSIGSIDLTGPKSLTALQSILQCRQENDSQFVNFMKLHKLNDLTSVPENTIFTFNVCDPRFKTKPVIPSKPKIDYDDQLEVLIALNSKTKSLSDDILNPKSRAQTYDNQMSLKELGKRRNLHPGEAIPVKENDASICIMLIKSYEQWTILLPWFWVVPFWHSLVHVPHVQFGGFKQSEQLRLERKLLGWSDMIFTTNGYVQCELEREEAERKWEKRPKSKRITYSKLKVDGLDCGETLSPFGLDWRGLQVLRLVTKKLSLEGKLEEMRNEQNNRIVTDDKLNIVPQTLSDLSIAVKAIQSAEKQLKKQNLHSVLLQYKPITLATDVTSDIDLHKLTVNIKQLPALAVTPIYLTCVGKGNIASNARIYEVGKEYESVWKETALGQVTNIRGKSVRVGSILEAEKFHPKLHNIVGLVSSATFSLVEGKSIGIGFVDSEAISGDVEGCFLVRNVASTSYVLVHWNCINMAR